MIKNIIINASKTPSVPVVTPTKLYGWGLGRYGELDYNTTYARLKLVVTSSNWSVITTSNFTGMAIKTDGTLWGWGGNFNFQLGINNTNSNISSPVQVGALTNWSKVALASSHTIAVKTDGTLWAWGSGLNGRLGLNSVTTYSSPVQVGALTNWSSVSCGNSHTMAVKTDGTLWAWGLGTNGRLGDGGITSRSSPVQIGTLTDWSTVFCGMDYSMAIKTDGTLWGWGTNNNGQLGDGTITEYSSPVQVGTLTNWSSVSCGNSHTMAIKTDGTLWGWGTNFNGQLGIGDFSSRSSPVQIGTLTNWTANITCDNSNTMAVKTDGTLWAWGTNGFNGESTDYLYDETSNVYNTSRFQYTSPVQIGTLTSWSKVAAMRRYQTTTTNRPFIALTTTGDVYGGGSTVGYDVLTTLSYSSPIQLSNISNISFISNGNNKTFFINTSGSLWGMGEATGLGTETTSIPYKLYISPVQIGTLTNWSKIYANSDWRHAIKTDGTLWAWGHANANGQLGLGNTDTVTYSSPVQVGALTNWSKIAHGADYTMAVKTDGTLWAWGNGSNGRLGDGGITSRSSPVQIGTLTNWSEVTCGYSHTVAVKTDGTLWVWGAGANGRLGLSSTVTYSSPVQVGALTNWSKVSAYGSYTMSVKTNGTLWAWGVNNSYGQLGDGTTTNRSSPVQIGTLTNWSTVYTGANSTTIAIKTNGTMWAWGNNNNGQLGDGSTTSRSSPVQIGTLTNWSNVSISKDAAFGGSYDTVIAITS
jgi:alpha-tubulin suppressor-like RCC1 family protein